MNDQLNQSGQLSNSQDGCQTNSRRYDSFMTGPVRSAIPSNSWASCCESCRWPWLCPPQTALRYVMYFRLCGWRHVFTQWPYGGSCVFLSGNRTLQAYQPRFPNTFCSTIKTASKLTGSELHIEGEVCYLRLPYYLCPFAFMRREWTKLLLIDQNFGWK